MAAMGPPPPPPMPMNMMGMGPPPPPHMLPMHNVPRSFPMGPPDQFMPRFEEDMRDPAILRDLPLEDPKAPIYAAYIFRKGPAEPGQSKSWRTIKRSVVPLTSDDLYEQYKLSGNRESPLKAYESLPDVLREAVERTIREHNLNEENREIYEWSLAHLDIKKRADPAAVSPTLIFRPRPRMIIEKVSLIIKRLMRPDAYEDMMQSHSPPPPLRGPMPMHGLPPPPPGAPMLPPGMGPPGMMPPGFPMQNRPPGGPPQPPGNKSPGPVKAKKESAGDKTKGTKPKKDNKVRDFLESLDESQVPKGGELREEIKIKRKVSKPSVKAKGRSPSNSPSRRRGSASPRPPQSRRPSDDRPSRRSSRYRYEHTSEEESDEVTEYSDSSPPLSMRSDDRYVRRRPHWDQSPRRGSYEKRSRHKIERRPSHRDGRESSRRASHDYDDHYDQEEQRRRRHSTYGDFRASSPELERQRERVQPPPVIQYHHHHYNPHGADASLDLQPRFRAPRALEYRPLPLSQPVNPPYPTEAFPIESSLSSFTDESFTAPRRGRALSDYDNDSVPPIPAAPNPPGFHRPSLSAEERADLEYRRINERRAYHAGRQDEATNGRGRGRQLDDLRDMRRDQSRRVEELQNNFDRRWSTASAYTGHL
jgi:hypothetical protein